MIYFDFLQIHPELSLLVYLAQEVFFLRADIRGCRTLRYWQNEGYQAAFDGMADAEWNIE